MCCVVHPSVLLSMLLLVEASLAFTMYLLKWRECTYVGIPIPKVDNFFYLSMRRYLALPLVPDASVADGTAAGTEATVAISKCHDNHLKACIVALSASVWGVQDVFLCSSMLYITYYIPHAKSSLW
jgi:hypothetical protein